MLERRCQLAVFNSRCPGICVYAFLHCPSRPMLLSLSLRSVHCSYSKYLPPLTRIIPASSLFLPRLSAMSLEQSILTSPSVFQTSIATPLVSQFLPCCPSYKISSLSAAFSHRLILEAIYDQHCLAVKGVLLSGSWFLVIHPGDVGVILVAVLSHNHQC